MRELKIWNGRAARTWRLLGKRTEPTEWRNFYVCAYSRRDAARICAEATEPREPDAKTLGQWDREIKVYFSEGCWGDQMEGIAQERGLWATKDFDDKPIRIT